MGIGALHGPLGDGADTMNHVQAKNRVPFGCSAGEGLLHRGGAGSTGLHGPEGESATCNTLGLGVGGPGTDGPTYAAQSLFGTAVPRAWRVHRMTVVQSLVLRSAKLPHPLVAVQLP